MAKGKAKRGPTPRRARAAPPADGWEAAAVAAAEAEVARTMKRPGPAPREVNLDAVRRAAVGVATAQAALEAAVAGARQLGATWRQLGEVLGVTPQAVQKRFGR